MTMDELVERMKAEIVQDMVHGRLPVEVGDFSELHDFVDANEYGGLCTGEVYNALYKQFCGFGETMPDAMAEFIESAQDRVSVWLSDWGHIPLVNEAERIMDLDPVAAAKMLRSECWRWALRYQRRGREQRA